MPQPRGAAVDMARVSGWLADFAGYRFPINEGRIDRWIKQFEPNDYDLATRLLDCVDFVSQARMIVAFRSFFDICEGWDINPEQRRGKWCFVAYSASAGESGDEMLHLFRLANKLNGRQYNQLFKYKSELVRENLGPSDTVVFVDDFSGTGTQVCNNWPEIQELLPGGPRVYLVLVAAGINACTKIEEETELNIIPNIRLQEHDNIFSPHCAHFIGEEKEKLLRYCQVADKRNPRGFGDCGFVIVLAHTCPNDSIPILHSSHANWEGLFRRYD